MICFLFLATYFLYAQGGQSLFLATYIPGREGHAGEKGAKERAVAVRVAK